MLETDFESLRRVPYFPVCADGGGGLTDSKFSGIPWLAEAELWPKCGNCQNEMQLFVQINLATLPAACPNFGSGLIQLFYCTNSEPHCEVDCESWFWNDKAMLVRIVVPEGESGAPSQSPVSKPFPAKRITRWQAEDAELPRVSELIDYVPMSLDEADELYDAEGAETYAGPAGGDKLNGWPVWIQDVEYPSCRICEKRMRLVFQIDSDVNLPYMWGDSGCSHITQCADHLDVLSFGWACM